MLACLGAWLGVATLDSWLLGVVLAIGCASTVPAVTAMPARRGPRPARPAAAGAWTAGRLARGAGLAVAVVAGAALVGVALGLRDGDLAVFVAAVAAGAGAAAAGVSPGG
ncbi:hypothetical protein [Miltoncostaea oceani]|uniref:hypothetical protein n=1 Tax=Miltoncostaea oceani TaxID=2843216 RepID=UPI001C3C6E6D|nr:hypothetical protein [Miltoncostaea oceani]